MSPLQIQPRVRTVEADLSERVREAREAKGWSVVTMAEHLAAAGCKVNGSSVWKMENGSRKITIDEAVAIAEVLGVPLTRLVYGERSDAITAAQEEAKRLEMEAADARRRYLALLGL